MLQTGHSKPRLFAMPFQLFRMYHPYSDTSRTAPSAAPAFSTSSSRKDAAVLGDVSWCSSAARYMPDTVARRVYHAIWMVCQHAPRPSDPDVPPWHAVPRSSTPDPRRARRARKPGTDRRARHATTWRAAQMPRNGRGDRDARMIKRNVPRGGARAPARSSAFGRATRPALSTPAPASSDTARLPTTHGRASAGRRPRAQRAPSPPRLEAAPSGVLADRARRVPAPPG